MKNKKLTVTVGIPAYNESANIGNLLNSLLTQKQDDFVLQKIVVVCDGSTDGTEKIVTEMQKKNKIIVCNFDPIRRGHTYRMQQLLTLNSSEILVFFDGDTMPKNDKTLSLLIAPFYDKKINMTAANLLPTNPVKLFEFILFCWYMLWFHVSLTWNKGNNLFNIHGGGIALRKKLTDKIRLPVTLSTSSAKYMYLYLEKQNLGFLFCKESVIYFRLPATFQDHQLQSARGNSELKKIEKILNISVNEYTIVPKQIKFNALISSLFIHPVITVVGLSFFIFSQIYDRFFPQSQYEKLWPSVKSTKSLIKIENISK